MKTKYIVLFILAILAVAAVITSLNSSIATAVGTDVVSKYVAQDLPLADPDDAMWDMATPADVPLSGQVVIAPTNEAPSVTSMRVRSLNNAQWIAFLLEWDDPTKDVGGADAARRSQRTLGATTTTCSLAGTSVALTRASTTRASSTGTNALLTLRGLPRIWLQAE